MKNIILTIVTFSILTACKKSDLEDLQVNTQSIKVYDDSLASGENPNVKISSGKRHLYMVYAIEIELTKMPNKF